MEIAGEELNDHQLRLVYREFLQILKNLLEIYLRIIKNFSVIITCRNSDFFNEMLNDFSLKQILIIFHVSPKRKTLV